MKHRLLIIVAPFGFGPAARALLIAHALAGEAEITLFSNMDALQFIERHRPGNTCCRSGLFGKEYPAAADLEAFDYFVSVNNEPAVSHLIRLGFAARTIFLDSVLPWRSSHVASEFSQPIRAYLVQDFPGAKEHLAECKARSVALVAPTLWSSRRDRAEDQDATAPITLHLGGITSPIAGWQEQLPLIESLARAALLIARHHARKLVLLGNARIRTLSVCNDPAVVLLAGVSPAEAAEAIGQSAILLSTPGISAVYEAFASGTPCVLLPPMNSTQLHQYRAFAASGVPGSITRDAEITFFQTVASLAWEKQSHFCLEWLRNNPPAAFGRLVPEIAQLLDPASGASCRARARAAQRSFLDSLSGLSAVDMLRRIFSES